MKSIDGTLSAFELNGVKTPKKAATTEQNNSFISRNTGGKVNQEMLSWEVFRRKWQNLAMKRPFFLYKSEATNRLVFVAS